MSLFKLNSPFKPTGSQPQAIKELCAQRPGISTLMGVTGSGKTFTMANVIAKQDKPVLIISPNKTLAAQLYEEFSLFFPQNKVCYFVSYYDYYQPESYLPAQDMYIAKEIKVNKELERLRIETTSSLMSRPDTIVIASVSAIYALGDPEDYRKLAFPLQVGQAISRTDLLRRLIFIQYERNDMERDPGTFQVVGNSIEVNLPEQKEKLRIEVFGNKIESLQWVTKRNNKVIKNLEDALIFPAKHFVTTKERKNLAIKSIQAELDEHLPTVQNPVYKERLQQRVGHDLEMIKEYGYCSGIENYSVHLDGRRTGERPNCLFDFFPKDFLCIIDESHVALPQLRGMFAGDRARKKVLVEHGFRLPTAFDNRPLTFEETEKFFSNAVFVSATPGDYELKQSDNLVEQIIRPTGLVDPEIEVVERTGQMDHLIKNIKAVRDKDQRTLVTVLTKRMAEDLARFLQEQQLKVCYMHGDIKTPERTELLQKLRQGVFDCLVGVNLLREGLDLPEVALVAIMDADVESFLRDKRSLIQTVGRAARNLDARVLMYGDKISKSMKAAIDETNRRRKLQQDHNEKHGIVPATVKRDASRTISPLQEAISNASKSTKARKKDKKKVLSATDIEKRKADLEVEMRQAAEELDFEKAIKLRQEWLKL